MFLTACVSSPREYIAYHRNNTYNELSKIYFMTPKGNDLEILTEGHILDLDWSTDGRFLTLSKIVPDDQHLVIGLSDLTNKTFLKENPFPESFVYATRVPRTRSLSLEVFNISLDQFTGIRIIDNERILFGINKPEGAYICELRFEAFDADDEILEPECKNISNILNLSDFWLIDFDINDTNSILLSIRNKNFDKRVEKIYLTDFNFENIEFLINGSFPEFNFDGTKMAFISEDLEICEMNLINQEVKAVYAPYKDYEISEPLRSLQMVHPVSHPSYSSDEKSIVFCGTRVPDHPSSIYKIDIKSSQIEMLTPQNDGSSCLPLWRYIMEYKSVIND
jgi:Tol biopolymer transport system component